MRKLIISFLLDLFNIKNEKMKFTLIVAVFFFNFSPIKTQAQNNGMPPPPLVPTTEQEKLIDELIIVTHFEDFFNQYCNNLIDETAESKKWSAAKIKNKKNKIQFADFRFTIYNNYASIKTEDLKTLTSLLKKINQEGDSIFLGNDSIINNLRNLVK